MAITMSSLTSSFASLSFTSQISQKPNSISLAFAKPNCSTLVKRHSPLVVAANAAAVAGETEDLKKFVKATLPGGFAAQTLWGTGRRKSAIARVVLKEGTGKVIINYRDAKVWCFSFLFSLNWFWWFCSNSGDICCGIDFGLTDTSRIVKCGVYRDVILVFV